MNDGTFVLVVGLATLCALLALIIVGAHRHTSKLERKLDAARATIEEMKCRAS